MRAMLLGISAACLVASAAAAQSAIAIQRSVYLENRTVDARGASLRSLEPAAELKRGDVVVLMLEWNAPGKTDKFVVTSRIPRDLAFRRAGGKHAQVSIDGGRNWGELGLLRAGNRKATAEDVTHLRWHVSNADAALGRGMLTYSAIVR